MFYTSEDIKPAVATATKMFGLAGNMIVYVGDTNPPHVHVNLTLNTPQFGKIWYGDVECSQQELLKRVDILGKKIGQPVTIS
jgi:hypothetical protein